MDVIKSFLESEIITGGLYEEVMLYITSFHVRSGEFEGNEYVIEKMDQVNFIIHCGFTERTKKRTLLCAEAIYRNTLMKEINDYASEKGFDITKWDDDMWKNP